MRIALDAMGSDDRPIPDVAGAVLAARDFGDTILLVGDQPRVEAELAKHDTSGLAFEIIHAPDVIEMGESPSTAGKAKPQSSMHVGMRLVKDGQADGFVTAGNTGAAMVVATLHTLRRIPGVKRPALCSIISFGYHRIIMLDIGANADARPEFLAQFAVMGDIYARKGLGLENPRVAILSNGEEEGKEPTICRQRGNGREECADGAAHRQPCAIAHDDAAACGLDIASLLARETDFELPGKESGDE